ncbi:MAG: TIR domain-containing protein [Desulfobacterales bacterium]|nr:TIR domain-containing protein [Desulfobacterales bacterium]
MIFKYSCFISYSSGQRELIQQFVEELEEALNAEIELWIKQYPVFLDRTRLQSGDIINAGIASALCYSISMVAVLTPAYYKQPNCLREYSAMESLEKDRFEKMNWPVNSPVGLIFPIVLRNPDRIPDSIKKYRQCLDFSTYMLSPAKILENTKFAEDIQKIAERIYDYFENFDESRIDFCEDCESFELPPEKEVPILRKRFRPPPKPFPFR